MAQLDTTALQYLHRRAIFFNIERKLWKVVQSHVEQRRINLKFEAPILQEQIITYIVYSVMW